MPSATRRVIALAEQHSAQPAGNTMERVTSGRLGRSGTAAKKGRHK